MDCGRAEAKVDPEEVLDAISPHRREKAERPSDTPPTPEPAFVEPLTDTRALEKLEGHIETLKGMLATAERRVSTERRRADDERGRTDVERAGADEITDRVDRLRLETLIRYGSDDVGMFNLEVLHGALLDVGALLPSVPPRVMAQRSAPA